MNLLFELFLTIFVFFISCGFGLVIYIKNPRSATHKFFFALSFLIDAYAIVNYLSLHPPLPTAESQLFWIRMVMVVTSFMGPATLLLVSTFPADRILLRLRYLIPLGILATASAVASATSLVFKDLMYVNGSPTPIPGPAIPIFFLDFVGIFLVSFGVIIAKYRQQKGEERMKYLYLLLGVVISFSLTSICTVILVVIFQNSKFVIFGSLAPIILMEFVAYAMIKHNLFDIKIYTGLKN